MSGSDGIIVANHSGALVEDRFEKITREFALAGFTDVTRDLAPHVGDENDVLQCRVTTKFVEHPKIPPSDSSKPIIGDAVDIDDPGKLRPFLVSVKKLSPGD